MAKHYTEVAVDKWNTAHFQAYLADEHLRLYGVQYAPKGGIVAERALLSKYIGTARKDGMYGKDVVKAFIDRCFQSYKPTPAYPGLTFWFMANWMIDEMQRIEAQSKIAEATTNAEGGDVEWL